MTIIGRAWRVGGEGQLLEELGNEGMNGNYWKSLEMRG